MKVVELVQACVDALSHPERSLPDEPLVTIVGKKTLFPRGGGPQPRRLLCVNTEGNKVWHYSAWNLLAALAAHGLIGVVSTAGGIKITFVKNDKEVGS